MKTRETGRWLRALWAGAAVVALGQAVPAGGEVLRGAEDILGLLKQELAAAPVATEGGDPSAALAADVASFRKAREGLPAEEAAKRWLGLFDRLWSLPPAAILGQGDLPFPLASATAAGERASLEGLLAALPSPDAWAPLKALASARQPEAEPERFRGTALRLLASVLTGDAQGTQATAAELRGSAFLRDLPQRDWVLSQLLELEGRVRVSGADRSAADRFDTLLQGLRALRGGQQAPLQVPDLVGAAGEERARELLTKALGTPGARLTVPAGGATLALTKRLILENVANLAEPQWLLVEGPEDAGLFEAMDRRFPEPQDEAAPELGAAYQNALFDRNLRNRTLPAYLAGLASAGREDEAVSRARKAPIEVLSSSSFEKAAAALDLRTKGPLFLSFLERLLSERPEAPLWDFYVKLSLQLGKSNEAQRRIEEIDGRPTLAGATRVNLKSALATARFASGETEKGIEALREAVRLAADGTPPGMIGAQLENNATIQRLCRVGLLLQRPALVDESLQAARRMLAAVRAPGPEAALTWALPPLLDDLLGAGRFTEAEGLVLDTLRAGVRALPAGSPREFALAAGAPREALSRLVAIYYAAGRHADTMSLLEQGPWWGVSDLSELLETDPGLAVPAAAGLAGKGHKEEAVAVLKRHLSSNPNDDKAYAPLADLSGEELVPWLDELYARDRFEERPLLWKAELLRRAGKLDEASAVAREALRVDPTDGEQPAGDRVRGYAVLASILKAQGKEQNADFFDRVVQSVRVAEKGDSFAEAGLLRESLALYQEAELAFVDAYCVQWRLAERFRALGDDEKARAHYEMAFERLPEQFGQVASFCFGCEGVFQSTESRDVAERVLTRLAGHMPAKPQVHYLLGELRASQGRPAEAYSHYRRATELDPEYLDAWRKAYGLRDHAALSPEARDEIALRMLRLDPLQRHGTGAVEITRDFRGLWQAVKEAERFSVPPPQPSWPLPASRAELERLKKAAGSDPSAGWMPPQGYPPEAAAGSQGPGEALLAQPLVAPVQLLLAASLAGAW